MTSPIKPHAREVLEYLRSIGAERVRLEPGARHVRAVFTWRERQFFYPLPSSPGSAVEVVSDIKHLLGLVGQQRRVGARRRRSLLRPRRRYSPGPAIIINFAPDWHQAVAEHPASVAMLRQRLDLAYRLWWRELMARQGGQSLL